MTSRVRLLMAGLPLGLVLSTIVIVATRPVSSFGRSLRPLLSENDRLGRAITLAAASLSGATLGQESAEATLPVTRRAGP